MGFVSDVIGGITGSSAAADAASDAGSAQARATEKGIAEQRRQFDALQKLLLPYVQAGSGAPGQKGALQLQQELLGIKGNAAQQSAIKALQTSPQFTSLIQQGENAILQNASATGGLRGGNTQGALAQFRPRILSQLIDQQYNRLGGLTTLGQQSAAGVGAAGQQSANSISDLLQQQGAAQAGGILAQGGVQRQNFSDILGIGGTLAGFGLF